MQDLGEGHDGVSGETARDADSLPEAWRTLGHPELSLLLACKQCEINPSPKLKCTQGSAFIFIELSCSLLSEGGGAPPHTLTLTPLLNFSAVAASLPARTHS